jgi:hypothetical protein
MAGSIRVPADTSNWREKLLADIVRRVKEREDPGVLRNLRHLQQNFEVHG